LLTTRAECDQVLDSLTAELAGYENRETNLNYADTKDARSQVNKAGRLAGINAEIASYTSILATPDITPTLRAQNTSKLRRANDKRDNLTDPGAARNTTLFLEDVDAEQVDSQVVVLSNAKTLVTNHRATLAA